MPCNQMINMNIKPPRPTAERKVESVPNVNALILNSGSRNMGSSTLDSIRAKATRNATPSISSVMTLTLVQPMSWWPEGSIP